MTAIEKVVWPPGNHEFCIRPESGKRSGEGNGVKPIKLDFMKHLLDQGWHHEVEVSSSEKLKFGRFDAALKTDDTLPVVIEWETGNISSSHRSLNKMALSILNESILGGILIIPSRNLYRYLTDRIGNVAELEVYFPLWRSIPAKTGVLKIFVIEHDSCNPRVRRIPKGTDGRSFI